MYVLCANIWVKPEFIKPFLEASLDNARNTRQEPGNLRFDVLQGEDDPNRFLFYEVYRSKEDLATHQKTEHYFRWRGAVADWMAQPRQGLRFQSHFYGDGQG